MILVHELKFLVCIIIVGIVLAMFGGGVSGGVDSKPDECKTNPNAPICEEFCYELFIKEGGDRDAIDTMMTNILCRNWHAGGWWIEPVLKE